MTNEEIVEAAVRALPGATFQKRTVADMAVANLALRIRAQVAEGSLAMRTLSAIPIPAVVESVGLEERSQRLIVQFRPDFQREGYEPIETIRTDRTDGWRGEAVRRLWSGVEGRHVRIYKLTEDTGDPQRPKVRVAPYVEVIGDEDEGEA